MSDCQRTYIRLQKMADDTQQMAASHHGGNVARHRCPPGSSHLYYFIIILYITGRRAVARHRQTGSRVARDVIVRSSNLTSHGN